MTVQCNMPHCSPARFSLTTESTGKPQKIDNATGVLDAAQAGVYDLSGNIGMCPWEKQGLSMREKQYSWVVNIPVDAECDSCVMQWSWYVTDNVGKACHADEDLPVAGNNNYWRNCMDVQILPPKQCSTKGDCLSGDCENGICTNKIYPTCSITDGSMNRSTYPCLCGNAVCGHHQTCNVAAENFKCEGIFVYGVADSDVCPDNYERIFDREACKSSAVDLNKGWDDASENVDNRPAGCYYSHWTRKMKFNSHTTGGNSTRHVAMCTTIPLKPGHISEAAFWALNNKEQIAASGLPQNIRDAVQNAEKTGQLMELLTDKELSELEQFKTASIMEPLSVAAKTVLVTPFVLTMISVFFKNPSA